MSAAGIDFFLVAETVSFRGCCRRIHCSLILESTGTFTLLPIEDEFLLTTTRRPLRPRSGTLETNPLPSIPSSRNRVYNLVGRRLLSTATIVIATVFLFAASVPASAQMHGGGRGATGGHGGFAGRGGFGSHMGSSQAFGGMHSGPGFGTRGFNRGPSFHQPAFRGDRFRQDHLRDARFRDRRFHHFGFRNCFGCWRWGWPWWYAGYYDPYWWWDSGSSYDQDRAREIELANEMNEQSLAEQRIRREEDQDLYARSDPRPQHGGTNRIYADYPADFLR